VALAAGLAAALYGPADLLRRGTAAVVPALFLELLLLLLLLHASPGGRWPWLLAGLLLGLAALTVANILLFLPCLLFWLGSTHHREGIPLRRIGQQAGLLLAGCLLVVAP